MKKNEVWLDLFLDLCDKHRGLFYGDNIDFLKKLKERYILHPKNYLWIMVALHDTNLTHSSYEQIKFYIFKRKILNRIWSLLAI